MSDDEVQQLLLQMDTDNSGEIDFNEFKNVMGQSFFKKYSRHEMEAAFKKFDADNNGFITANELHHILTRMGRQLSPKEVENIIKSVDSSGDGKISFNEFCKLFD